MKEVIKLYFVLTLVTFLIWNNFAAATYAQQSELLSINPSVADLKANDEKIIELHINTNTKISGFDLRFTTSSSLQIVDFINSIQTQPDINPFFIQQVAKSIDKSSARIGYIFKTASTSLPQNTTLYLKIRATNSTGQAKIILDSDNSFILDENGKPLPISKLTAIYALNASQSSTTFIEQTVIPSPKYPSTTAVVDLNLSLAGIDQSTKIDQPLKALAVAVGRIGEGKYESEPQQFTISQNPNGTFSGIVAFPNFKDGNKFSLMLKVDSYLLRRVCNLDPSEPKIGGYLCKDPELTIKQGQNSFDFSKISLLPGDLGISDGVLNGYDLSIVRNNLNKKTTEAIKLADINYDGLVDQKDFELLKQIAKNSTRQGDQ